MKITLKDLRGLIRETIEEAGWDEYEVSPTDHAIRIVQNLIDGEKVTEQDLHFVRATLSGEKHALPIDNKLDQHPMIIAARKKALGQ
jgi:hypothetical protein